MSEELVSIRGLIEGFQRSPLREFKGKLESFPTELVDKFLPAKTYVNLNFSEVEVLETTGEPYPFPIAQITMPLNKRRTCNWTVVADSIAKFVLENQDITNTIGMMYHMKMTPGHLMWNKDEGKATPREAWEVIGIAGQGVDVGVPIDATARALELLDGKVEEEWNQLVFQDPVVKADGKLIDRILHRQFLPEMEAAGKATKDSNGVWHTISEGEAGDKIK